MEKATYLAILLATVAGPAIAMLVSRRLRLTRGDWERMLAVFVCVSVPFVLLDALQHARGWWAYDADLIFGPRLLGLPIEEVAFFFAIPFSSLYLYSQFSRIPSLQKVINVSQRLLASVGLLLAVLLATAEPRERTVFDALLCLGVISTVSLIGAHYQLKRYDFVWFGAIIALFIIVNGVLTGLSVVTYNEVFGSGIRLGSIPLADGLYNVSLLLTALAVYRYRRPQVARPSSAS